MFEFSNASALSDGYDDVSSNGITEIDYYVPVAARSNFLKECSDKGFMVRRLPPIKRFHMLLERWEKAQHLSIDAQIGPYFEVGMFRHAQPHEGIRKHLFIQGESQFERLSLTGRAVFYAANCVWLKKKKFNEKNFEKLKRLCSDALRRECVNETICTTAMRAIVDMTEDKSLGFKKEKIREIIDPLFAVKVSPVSEILSRRTYPKSSEKADIIFLGPDGVGKSTLLQAVHDALPVKTGSGYLGIGKEGWKLKFAKRLSEQRSRRVPAAVFWYLVLPVELSLRRLLMLRKGRGRIILIDRVPGKPLLGDWLLRLLYMPILPRPCIVVLLSGDPEGIAARKPDETTPERTEKELAKWRRVAERLGAGRILEIDTTRHDVAACCDHVVEAIRTDPSVKLALYRDPFVKGDG